MLSGWAAFWIMIGMVGAAEVFGRYYYKSSRIEALAMGRLAREKIFPGSIDLILKRENGGGCSDSKKDVRKVRK